MEQIEKIRRHPLYQECMGKIEAAEKERIFCGHHTQHLLDVARIAYIRNLEQGLGFSKETIYSAALLHDIGKFRQYEDGTPHEKAGYEISRQILADCGVDGKECQNILDAILEHRRITSAMTELGRLLYDSDKMSRACYSCTAEVMCDWTKDKKNMKIVY